MTQRMVDPGARARSLVARRGGMFDSHKLGRQLRRLESRNDPVRADTLSPEEWSLVEEVDELPDADEDVVGRIWLQRNDDADDVLVAGITAADGTPIQVALSTLGNVSSIDFLWASQITGLTSMRGGLALDPSGNIYVNLASNLFKLNSVGTVLWNVTPGGSSTKHLAVDGTNVFMTEAGALQLVYKRLVSSGAAGSPASFGGPGSTNGLFASGGPIGIAYDGTNLWAVDPGNNRVQKFTAGGVYVSQFDGSSSGLAFTGPTGITIGPTSTHLYVLDAPNGRVVKFLKSDHSFVAEFVFGVGNGDGQISATAEGIAVDAAGRIWISDTGNHRIQVFDSAGAYLAKTGSFGSGDGQFKSPKQIAFNAAGDVAYVADSGNNRLVTVQEDLGQITPVITERAGGATNVGAGNTVSATATCAAGEVSIGGGWSDAFADMRVIASQRSGTTGWTLTVVNNAAGSRSFTPRVMCLKSPL